MSRNTLASRSASSTACQRWRSSSTGPASGSGQRPSVPKLELFLVDHAGRPLPRNQAVRVASADPRVTVELDRFNLELNASPGAARRAPIRRTEP